LCLGHTLSLTPYFSELRDELFQQKKKHAKDFIERLELAILIAVRIADKGSILITLFIFIIRCRRSFYSERQLQKQALQRLSVPDSKQQSGRVSNVFPSG
jgi:hypothetical protein